jgi:HORMA domain-containing protein
MTTTFTRSQTFTLSDVKYVTSKMAADLYRMKRLYGAPSDTQIENTILEVIELLWRAYLRDVHIGFKRNGNWVVAVRYQAYNGSLVGDDSAGGVPAGVDINGATHYNYLRYSDSFLNLSPTEQERIEASLPWRRTEGRLPGDSGGSWRSDRTYSSNGGGTARSSFSAR